MSAVISKRFSTKNHPDSYSFHGDAKEQLSFGQVRWQRDTRGDGTVLHHSGAGPAGNAMLAGALCAGLVATWAVGKVLDKREEDRRDKHEVARMTGKMKTVCVGRFLMDLPEEARTGLDQARIDGFDISTFVETEAEFQKRVANREAQIIAKPDRLGANKNLESAREVKTDSGLVGKIFIHSRTVEEGTQGNGLGGVERYRHEGITTEALVHGQGISIDLFYEDRVPDRIEDLPKLVKQLVANPENHIPAEPGFCMDRAYFRDPLTADQTEQIIMSARLPNHPDIHLMLMLMAGLEPDGDRRPESGWWLCSDGGNGIGVLGGERHYVKKGARIPELFEFCRIARRRRGTLSDTLSGTLSGTLIFVTNFIRGLRAGARDMQLVPAAAP